MTAQSNWCKAGAGEPTTSHHLKGSAYRLNEIFRYLLIKQIILQNQQQMLYIKTNMTLCQIQCKENQSIMCTKCEDLQIIIIIITIMKISSINRNTRKTKTGTPVKGEGAGRGSFPSDKCYFNKMQETTLL